MRQRRDLAGEPLVRAWASQAWPLIVRRRLTSDGAGLPLGLPLPPSAGKRRIALELPSAAVCSTLPLPELCDVIGAAPEAWRPPLAQVQNIARTYAVRAGVFGSLGWQWLTGMTYLGPHSDVDIAWTLPRTERLEWFLDELAAADSVSPVRLDGEVIRDDGAGVNWRELRAGVAELAVKTAAGVTLWSRAEFLGADA